MLGLLAIIVVSILTHSSRTVVLDGSSSIPAAFFLFPVAAVLGIADLALCFLMEKIFAPRAQAVLQIVTMVVLILGAGFMPRGSSYTTNDITYIFIILAPLLGFGNSGLVSAVSFISTLSIVFVPLMMWLVWESVSLTMDFFFFNLAKTPLGFESVWPSMPEYEIRLAIGRTSITAQNAKKKQFFALQEVLCILLHKARNMHVPT